MPAELTFTGEDKDLTLDELATFVEDARRAGVPGANPIRADLSTSGKIKKIQVSVREDDD